MPYGLAVVGSVVVLRTTGGHGSLPYDDTRHTNLVKLVNNCVI
jgi:hypothetical protein